MTQTELQEDTQRIGYSVTVLIETQNGFIEQNFYCRRDYKYNRRSYQNNYSNLWETLGYDKSDRLTTLSNMQTKVCNYVDRFAVSK